MCSTQAGDRSRNFIYKHVLNCLLMLRLCWLLHLGSLHWFQTCLLVNTSVRSIFRIRDWDRSVVQESNQACSATSEMFCGGTVLGPWSLMIWICFLTLKCILCGFLEVLGDISWLSDCSVESGEAISQIHGGQGLGVSWYRPCPWHQWSFSWHVLWK